MNPLVIVAVVVVIIVVVALVASNPLLRRREDEAIAAVKQQLGSVDLIEPRTTAMGTEPEEAGGVRGMACLGLSDAELMAVTWAGGNTWRIPRASVTAVDSSSDDPETAPKSTITVTYARPEGGEGVAMFRLRDAGDWLDALGYGKRSGDADGPSGSTGTDTVDDEGGGSPPPGDGGGAVPGSDAG
jgi:hypothetical protein